MFEPPETFITVSDVKMSPGHLKVSRARCEGVGRRTNANTKVVQEPFFNRVSNVITAVLFSSSQNYSLSLSLFFFEMD